MTRLHRAFEYIWKVPACGLAFSIASMAAAAILTAAGLRAPAMPSGMDQQSSALLSIALCPVLALGLAPLASGLSGSYRVRLALAFLVFINLGVNTTIESAIFSTILAKGGAAFLVLMYAVATTAFGAALARFFRSVGSAPRNAPSVGNILGLASSPCRARLSRSLFCLWRGDWSVRYRPLPCWRGRPGSA